MSTVADQPAADPGHGEADGAGAGAGIRPVAGLLEVSGLTRSFGGVTAVDHLDLSVAPGETVSIIGPNGAGKSTAFNLSPLYVDRVLELIRTINQQGVTIFMVEQNANLALQIAHYGYVLQTGRIALARPAPDLLRNPQICAAYLGGEQAALVGSTLR